MFEVNILVILRHGTWSTWRNRLTIRQLEQHRIWFSRYSLTRIIKTYVTWVHYFLSTYYSHYYVEENVILITDCHWHCDSYNDFFNFFFIFRCLIVFSNQRVIILDYFLCMWEEKTYAIYINIFMKLLLLLYI